MRERILVVDDDRTVSRILRSMLEIEGYRVEEAAGAEGLVDRIAEDPPHLVLLDVHMPRMSGLEVLAELQRRLPERVPVVMLTGESENVELAVETLKHGAMEYLVKPVAMERLHAVVRTTLQLHALRRENQRLQAELAALRAAASAAAPGAEEAEGELVGTSAALADARDLVARVAPFAVPVLVLGERGCGRGRIARLLHRLSPRAAQTFVRVRCGAAPEALLAHELFGPDDGAGGDEGVLERARAGTVYLEEVAELPPRLQRRLLDALPRPADAAREAAAGGAPRLVASASADLAPLVRDGRFDAELARRLAEVTLAIPPLRERLEDLPALCEHLVRALNRGAGRELAGVAPGAVARLLEHDWPGNVRELQAVLVQAHARAAGDRVEQHDLPLELLGPPRAGGRRRGSAGSPPREAILEALAACGGNRSEAARRLGIGRTTLWRRLGGTGRSGTPPS